MLWLILLVRSHGALRNRRLVALCGDCDTSYEVTDRAELDGWAREHWLTTHPWAERVRVVR